METNRQEFRRVWLLLAVFAASAAIVLPAWRFAGTGIPENAGRPLTAAEQTEIIARNSPLTEYVYLSVNADFPREDAVKKITIHHMADDIPLERLGEVFAQPDRRASSNYAIDTEGRVALYVEEGNRAWTSSSPENDHQAVTIEVANDEIGGEWHVSDASYEALLQLCTDICWRSGIQSLEYTGDETGNLTIHKMFSDRTECPGPYLEGKMPEIAEEVSRRLEILREVLGN
ncbi:peptidoglycan recognition family protein [Oscillospiraceae bacterium 50-60]|nr:N-acetylmuramoyl-L-alanine amidase [Oscillibacter sp.]